MLFCFYQLNRLNLKCYAEASFSHLHSPCLLSVPLDLNHLDLVLLLLALVLGDDD